MTDLSPTQRRVLEAASKQPKPDIREHMLDIKSPAIRDKVLQSMLKHGLLVEYPDANGVAYIVSDAGRAAISTPAPAISAVKTRNQKPALEQPARNSKKDIIIALLGGGATVAQIMAATGWQKHSVHGALANLKSRDGIAIASTKADDGVRVYKSA